MAASPGIVSNEAVACDFALWAEVIADSWVGRGRIYLISEVRAPNTHSMLILH